MLGDTANGRMELNDLGDIVARFWLQVPVRFPSVIIDACVTMPNHGHAIIVITDACRGVVATPVAGGAEQGRETQPLRNPADPGANIRRGVVSTPIATPDPRRAAVDPRQGGETTPLRPLTLGQIVAFYKYQTTKTINQMRDMVGMRFWQRNYWEHVIRSDAEMQRIREYIQTNPARWSDDQLHPDARANRFNQD